jgi:predicted nucleic acid-binding protein
MIVLDAGMIISFGNVHQFALLDGLLHDRLCVSGRARTEVNRDPARMLMEASIAAGRLAVHAVDLANAAEQEALRRYDARPAFRNRGDAEVLALASSRGYMVASDERAIRSAVHNELGTQRLAGTADFIVWAVREGRLQLEAAERLLHEIDSGKRILRQLRQSGKMFSDLL